MPTQAQSMHIKKKNGGRTNKEQFFEETKTNEETKAYMYAQTHKKKLHFLFSRAGFCLLSLRGCGLLYCWYLFYFFLFFPAF